jgi:hypothetical protein
MKAGSVADDLDRDRPQRLGHRASVIAEMIPPFIRSRSRALRRIIV